MVKVVWLVLTVWNADTGTQLYHYEEQMSQFSVSGNRIEDCRELGIKLAHKLSAKYRAAGYPNAFTNVDCEWRPGRPSNPA